MLIFFKGTSKNLFFKFLENFNPNSLSAKDALVYMGIFVGNWANPRKLVPQFQPFFRCDLYINGILK
jgi:hypothetical protein